MKNARHITDHVQFLIVVGRNAGREKCAATTCSESCEIDGLGEQGLGEAEDCEEVEMFGHFVWIFY